MIKDKFYNSRTFRLSKKHAAIAFTIVGLIAGSAYLTERFDLGAKIYNRYKDISYDMENKISGFYRIKK